MTLPSTFPITLGQVYAEFGAPAGTPLGSFLRGGPYVPNTSANQGVPTTLPISLGQLLGAAKYQPPTISGPSTVSWSGLQNRPPITFNQSSGQSVTGGTNSFTVAWSFISGDGGIACVDPTTVSGPFKASGGLPGDNPFTYTALWRLTVNDGGQGATKDVTFQFSSG